MTIHDSVRVEFELTSVDRVDRWQSVASARPHGCRTGFETHLSALRGPGTCRRFSVSCETFANIVCHCAGAALSAAQTFRPYKAREH